MKYMTFHSSCSYAGLANMLEEYGIDANDYEIALAMKLPYLFAYEDGTYLSGSMLQSSKWFNLYLNPIGYQLSEKWISKEKIAEYLKKQKTAMIGIRSNGTQKHAVIYKGMEDDHLIFLNNKKKGENAPEEIWLTEDELKQRVDAEVVAGTLKKIPPKAVSLKKVMQNSISVVQSNVSEILELSVRNESVENLRLKMNFLFRPLFLDGISMLNLIEEYELAGKFTQLQSELLQALRQDSAEYIYLKDYLSLDLLKRAADEYIFLIQKEIESENE